MPKPTKEKEPKGRRNYKIEQRGQQSSLDQLTEPRDEETHQRGNKITWGFSHHLKIRIPMEFRSSDLVPSQHLTDFVYQLLRIYRLRQKTHKACGKRFPPFFRVRAPRHCYHRGISSLFGR
jgi:hypothetical protein